MSANTTSNGLRARATCVLQPERVSKVLCHRVRAKEEQYLVRWRAGPDVAASVAEAICSWHTLWELTRCLHLVQKYVEKRAKTIHKPRAHSRSSGTALNRKRKSPDDDPLESRDFRNGHLTTEGSSSRTSHSPSQSSATSASSITETEPLVYNGVLERRDGHVLASKPKGAYAPTIDATTLPTPAMSNVSLYAPVSQAERFIRQAFCTKLSKVSQLYLRNDVDESTPSLDFKFIKEYILRDGVERADLETQEGCVKPCRPNMGQHMGCELAAECICLEFAAVDEDRLQAKDSEVFKEYMRLKESGEYVDTAGLPKRFPYQKGKSSHVPSRLIRFYRESRHPIYECNERCSCGSVCKSRVVQKGRKVPLTIFKTANRGWGVYCNEDLVQGEFIDTYRGEVITNAEADQRESDAGVDKASYLYSLDKFVGQGNPELTNKTCHVVDGEYMGGPTRFINHSCEPNCRQFTVSYNKYDNWIYDIAFFALEDIPRGTELTFDYVDQDEDEEEDVLLKRANAAKDPSNRDKKPCHCGARKCRGYLWV